MEQISAMVWRYHDAFGSTSYLVVGKTRAVMIDCSMEPGPIMPRIQQITNLPVDLLLTHAHPDHYGAAAEFEHIWMNEKDIVALDEMEPVFAGMGVKPLPRAQLHAFGDGHVFDLGGRRLIAAELTGHTPGSTVFVDETQKAIFSGDAVGSGDIVLMAVPKAFTLSAYRQSLAAFLGRSAPWAEYAWYAGHWHQADRGEGKVRNDPCRALIEDMIRLCDEILAGRIVGDAVQESFAPDGVAYRAYLGRAGIVYCDHQKK
ncbi:MAG: MBL fold metallo-hydrolase [Clostridia bacterium]|nr:MBL fold metallo-hydrolase [Clostridia bacterium]